MPKVVISDTKLKLSLRGQGVSAKVFDKSNNLVHQFPTITSTAKYFGVTCSTISKIFNKGKSYDEFVYKFDVKDLRVWVYNYNDKLVKFFNNAKKASAGCSIPPATLSNYIKSGKLYNNKYYFYNINYKFNTDFGIDD
jgi:hypothetical protein